MLSASLDVPVVSCAVGPADSVVLTAVDVLEVSAVARFPAVAAVSNDVDVSSAT